MIPIIVIPVIYIVFEHAGDSVKKYFKNGKTAG